MSRKPRRNAFWRGFSILDLEVVQQGLVVVLGGEASVHEISVYMPPLPKPPVIEELEILGNNKWNDSVRKAFLEHHKSSYPAVAILKRMDGLKFLMEVYDVLQGLESLGVICREKRLHPHMHLFRRAGRVPSHFIRKLLIVPDVEPRFETVRGAGLKKPVQFLDKRFGKPFLRPVNDKVDAAEVIHGLHDVIDIDTFVGYLDRVCLEDKPGLFMRQAAPLDMIGVVCEVYLGAVIDTTADPSFFFFPEALQ